MQSHLKAYPWMWAYLLHVFEEICVSYSNRELSSAGSEHLPYKQRVGGSNPSAPTKASVSEAFLFWCVEIPNCIVFQSQFLPI